MLQAKLISHGASTLANLKAGTLIRLPNTALLEEEMRDASSILDPKGIRLSLLQSSADSVLLFMYREKRLSGILNREDIQCFLSQYGYYDFSVDSAIRQLSERIARTPDDCFPHEIGIFLDYPLADVIAFILNKGQHCVCCGCWKAYTDRCGALRKFAQFTKCREVYMRLFAEGVSLERLAVRSY